MDLDGGGSKDRRLVDTEIQLLKKLDHGNIMRLSEPLGLVSKLLSSGCDSDQHLVREVLCGWHEPFPHISRSCTDCTC